MGLTEGYEMICTKDAQQNESKSYSLTGLSSAEVEERICAGKTNINTDIKTKSVPQIIALHTCTLFNAVNLFLGVLVFTTGELRNIFFMVIVLLNLGIGVFQEIRAKILVDKLTILNRARIRVMRDGREVSITTEEIVMDDVVMLARGEQAPADGFVLEGICAMDESLLTGESNPIEKAKDARIFSGSYVDSGSILYQVDGIAGDSLAAKINAAAKYIKPIRSEIVSTIRTIITYATYVLIPLGLLLFGRIFLIDHLPYNTAILQAVAATVGMIPQGLVLLTSTIFAIATTKLASKHVLVQQSYCIETLARVDVVCLDKTGTITTGAMEVSSVCDERGRLESLGCTAVKEACTYVVSASKDSANETARAILRSFNDVVVAEDMIVRAIPFSSRTKYSGCVLKDGRAYVMGACQFVLGNTSAQYEHVLSEFPPMTRVLVAGECSGFDDAGQILDASSIHVCGFIGIQEEIRTSAAPTLAYFAQEGVDVRIISGDDPKTVSEIAAQVGIRDASSYIDCTTLTNNDAIAQAASTYRVFGRVTPECKRSLVRALQAQGHIVAMTGDGVNDVLALKESDCSIAMSQGSAAARNVSELVLADNDFSHIPDIVVEGRRSINNLSRSAALFLTKTVYSGLLALICLLMPPYPFIPIQMSVVNVAAIGIPSFLLALEVNHDRVHGSFLAHVLLRSLPASFAIVTELVITMSIAKYIGIPDAVMSSMCMIEMAAVGIALIYQISRPLNYLRSFVVVLCIAIVVFGCVVIPDFLRIGRLNEIELLWCMSITLFGMVLFFVSYALLHKHKDFISRFIS